MAKVSMIVHVNGYAPQYQADNFQTIKEAIGEFRASIEEAKSMGAGYDIDGDNGGCAWLAYGHTDEIDYPDAMLTVGKRGGIKLSHHV